ncbi:SDR family NAD(P)-dependent oxidoreductase [Streptomyces microflavus]|uniref:Glucose 1-dehydrogenase n=1 Tax=Streptomyces microflavus TaxID=1919 RepID=A0A6N9VBY0_STRMI|nr:MULTISPECIES: glucose 1-dehydrogenase [Streptomyces]MBW3361767.1 glucose 1-dehydrogenase [Streptomyces sp. 09ZI22]MEE1728037.1 glucose 1-dehydrogenase [Streptomyces sp. BE282]NEB68972.1 glucose 1-dehydrogenase [Streptomyces microflavus]OXY95983.1 oxidoreductase [Streptomyces sp. 2R]QQZ57016.1 glucose 1-dehydrogenase [Streptomyces microflavus]
MARLEGKTALVTGGNRGIGAAVALRLAAEGADVAITYARNKDAAEATTEKIRSEGRRTLALAADATDAEAVRSAVDATALEFGAIDILVNNAGYADMSMPALEDVSLEVLDRTLGVNVRGAFLTAQAVSRHMGEGGRIVNIGSCLATRVPAGGLTSYAMSKAAIAGLTQGLARDLGSRGITVNQVAPGSIDTDMNPADGPGADFQRAHIIFGRYGTADEIAQAVAFLVSEEAAYITGATLAVDGGTNV